MNFIKKMLLTSFILVFMLLMLPDVIFSSDRIGVLINGEPVMFTDQHPALIDDRTLVPVRGVFEHLGFDVDWDNSIRAAILTRSDFEIIISIDSYIFTTNGTQLSLEVPAQIIGGRTLLPIRALLESAGYNVGWDSSLPAVLVYGTQLSVPVAPVLDERLVGIWYWQGSPYYSFRSDGRGFIAPETRNINIRWWTNDGMVFICNTPPLCDDICDLPTRWYYELDGNLLILKSATIDVTFVHKRQ